jgi:hypothetical protein
MRSRTKLSITRTHNRKCNSRTVSTSLGRKFPVPTMHVTVSFFACNLVLTAGTPGEFQIAPLRPITNPERRNFNGVS